MRKTTVHRILVVLIVAVLPMVLRPIGAQAFSCDLPSTHFIADTQEKLSTAEELRFHSIAIARNLAFQMNLSGGKIVVGHFHRKSNKQFLHEAQYEKIQSMYWPRSEETEMPYDIEYKYLGAYRFDGHEISDGALIPFSTDKIDAHVTISSDYSGVLDILPRTDQNLVGFLRKPDEKDSFRLTTAICPTYFSIDPNQLADLLECLRQGECEIPSSR